MLTKYELEERKKLLRSQAEQYKIQLKNKNDNLIIEALLAREHEDNIIRRLMLIALIIFLVIVFVMGFLRLYE